MLPRNLASLVGIVVLGTTMLGCADARRSRALRTASESDSASLSVEESAPSLRSDAQFFAQLRAANDEEIHAAELASDKALSVEVKAYARTLIRSRTDMIVNATRLQDEMVKRAIRAAGGKAHPQRDSLLRLERDSLNLAATPARLASGDSAPKGRDIDRVYLDAVVRRNRALLQLFVSAMRGAQSTDVRYFIQQNAPVIVRELDWAQSLRRTIQ